MLDPVITWLKQIGADNRASLKHFYFYDRNQSQDIFNDRALEELEKCAIVTELQGRVETLSGTDCCCHLVTFGETRRTLRDGLPAVEPGVPRLRLDGEI